jgi:EAL domain-containing protein (putative c-di-GMP-specific phosphodiesterase class I)
MTAALVRHDTVRPLRVVAEASTDRAGEARRAVLVVDDNVELARAIERLLSRHGFHVVRVDSGQSAVRALMRESFDAVVTDIEMPGMTGVDLLGAVRAYDLDVPVILMTGAPTIESAIEAVSLGALQYLQKPTSNDVLLKAVERASSVHRAARVKRDAVRRVGEPVGPDRETAGLSLRLDRAIETMRVLFQPIVSAREQRVFGYEALMRTDEPSLHDPGAVLSAAERLDRLPDVGRRMRALSAAAFEHAPRGTLLFVNLHTKDLLDPTLYDSDAPLAEFADRVVLEITERATLGDLRDLKARVSVLRYLGYRLAVDDLGAGYSGLSSFVALEPEIVKLDMSLVRDVHRSDVQRKLIGSMTRMCGEMGVRVIAEGIELEEERRGLLEAGCDLMQGYLHGRPGPAFPVATRY